MASHDVEPMLIKAKVYSTLGRQLLDMIGKVDQLMPMLEKLCIDEAISASQLNIEKSRIKNVRSTASATRMIRMGLERRLGAVQNPNLKRPNVDGDLTETIPIGR